MSNHTAPSSIGMSDAVADQIIRQTNVYMNLDQDTIIITEDRVRLCLISYLKKIELKNGWITPTGIFVTILIAILTSEFKKFIFDAPVWQAIFIITGIVMFCWLVQALIRSIKSPNIDDIVAELKKVSKPSTSDIGQSISIKQISEFKILDAVYGTENSGSDVTNKLNTLIENNRLIMIANNEIFGDPEKGKVKTLWINYSVNGEIKKIAFPENSEVHLP